MIGHKYTAEEHGFMREYIPGHTYKETQEAFTVRFGWDISVGQIKGYMANHKLNNGLTGRFKKGCVPPNKGKKGQYFPGCEVSWFRKGHMPANHKPVGSERINVDGYVEIKVEEPKKWRLKQRMIWEQHHGPIPKGKIIVFLDGNPLNTDIENLALVDRKVSVRMNQSGLRYEDTESMLAAIKLAELMAGIGEAKRRARR